jgi:hypothetical protein
MLFFDLWFGFLKNWVFQIKLRPLRLLRVEIHFRTGLLSTFGEMFSSRRLKYKNFCKLAAELAVNSGRRSVGLCSLPTDNFNGINYFHFEQHFFAVFCNVKQIKQIQLFQYL